MEARLHFFDGSETDLQGLHIPALKHYRLIYESPAYGGELLGKRIPFIVIYEYLKGAKIRGKTQPNQLVTLSLPLLTNQGRSFTYNQSTYSDSQGNYELVAPYSNEEPKPDWPEQGKTIFAVRAVGPYKITSGNITKEVKLLEDEVLYGKVKYLDL
jgi:dolichyl-diphosphooligosaccharide--protein glycosyltransferase